jgi:hypothetical protein
VAKTGLGGGRGILFISLTPHRGKDQTGNLCFVKQNKKPHTKTRVYNMKRVKGDIEDINIMNINLLKHCENNVQRCAMRSDLMWNFFRNIFFSSQN